MRIRGKLTGLANIAGLKRVFREAQASVPTQIYCEKSIEAPAEQAVRGGET